MRMSVTPHERQFLLSYCAAVITVPLVAHVLAGVYFSRAGGALALLLLVSWGLFPYFAMALFAWAIRSRLIVLTATGLIALTDAAATMGALFPQSSTAGVALVVQPALGLLIAVVALVVGILSRVRAASYRRRRTRAS